MLTIPSAYTTGYNAGQPLIRVVRLEAVGADLWFSSLPLTITGVGATNTARLAAEVDGSAVAHIDEIDQSVDGASVAGLASVVSTQITLLNQDGYHSTLGPYNFGRRVELVAVL